MTISFLGSDRLKPGLQTTVRSIAFGRLGASKAAEAGTAKLLELGIGIRVFGLEAGGA
jgi:hypothetical protein